VATRSQPSPPDRRARENQDRADSHDWQHEQKLAEVALKAHTRLVELIRKRNGEQAGEAWRKHLIESAKIVLGDRATATVVELLS
jgi:DNA-binding FadR family transcriptional regulator